MTVRRKIILFAVAITLGVGSIAAVLGMRLYERRKRLVYIRGAIVRQNPDTRKQAPVADVEVSATDGIDHGNDQVRLFGGIYVALEFRCFIGSADYAELPAPGVSASGFA